MPTVFRRSVVLVVALVNIVAAEQSPDVPTRGLWDFNPQKLWEIDRVGGEPLRRPAELRVSAGGSVYFHDFDRHVSYACDDQGNVVATFARQGRRKGEVPRYMNCLAGDDQVVIVSPDRMYFYSSNGSFLDSAANNLFQRFPLLYFGGHEFLLGPGALTDVRDGEATIVRSDVAARNVETFAKIKVSDEERSGPPGAVVLGLTPQLLAARDPDSGAVFYGKNSEYKIYVANERGELRPTFGLKRAGALVSDEDKRAHFAGLGIPSDQLEQLVKALPNKAACYQRIQVNRGLVYVFAAAGFGVPCDSQQIDIFLPDGTYLYRSEIRFTEGKHILSGAENLRIQGDRLYVILEDDAGARTIARYSIALPEVHSRGEARPQGE